MPHSLSCPRGVYELPFRGNGGERIAVAINGSNRRVAERPFTAENEGDTYDQLWALLDSVDPVASLRAV